MAVLGLLMQAGLVVHPADVGHVNPDDKPVGWGQGARTWRRAASGAASSGALGRGGSAGGRTLTASF
jgi:hypothetical protein